MPAHTQSPSAPVVVSETDRAAGEAARQKFVTAFGDGGRIHIVRAPGRVNLIGEHTDYNDGLVLPMAIEPVVVIACRAREDAVVRLASTVYPGQVVEFALDRKITRGEPAWANYCRGVAAELEEAGIPLVGMDALIDNTLPVGGGLSSSAAIEVGTALSLLTLAGTELAPDRLALVCQRAEHEFALVPCGIMDQTIVAGGKPGHAMLFDCRSLAKSFIKVDPGDLRVVIANTMVHHELASGEYGKRRAQCEAGVAWFKARYPDAGIRALRDVTPKMIAEAEGLDPLILKRCRHVVTEIGRTQDASSALAKGNYELAGRLMKESHASLRDDYEVSCPELDFLADQAGAVKGVYGARMTGGGFGGCIVALVRPRSADALTEHLKRAYGERFGIDPTVFATTATGGAGVIE
ncbi:MAG: galactokinase [Phycisphaerae bacterium]|nr:galactokinase [Tepidisphaeraceae bacterium]